MFVLGNFMIALARVCRMVLSAITFMIIVRAIISWFSPDPFNPLVQILQRTTEPLLQPIRRFLPFSGIDFSPLVAIIIIQFFQSFVVQSMFEIGYHMKG